MKYNQKLIIPGELTDLNKYISSMNSNRYAGNNIKQAETKRVELLARKMKPCLKPVFVSFKWYCKNKKKDKDNIAFAKKYILDGLVSAGTLKNDTWDLVVGFKDEFEIDKNNPRVEITLEEI